MIQYQVEDHLLVEEFKEVLGNSSLAERRPTDDHDRLSKMVKHANLIISARDNGKLIGISRSITDFVYCTYLSDLAIDSNYQKMGIGKELIRQTKKQAPQAKLILLSSPAAKEYYPKIGMKSHEACFTLDDIEELV